MTRTEASIRHSLACPTKTGAPIRHRSPVEGRLIHDDGVLDVVSRVGHDGNARVLSGAKLVEADELDRVRGEEGSHGVAEKIQESVEAAGTEGGEGMSDGGDGGEEGEGREGMGAC